MAGRVQGVCICPEALWAREDLGCLWPAWTVFGEDHSGSRERTLWRETSGLLHVFSEHVMENRAGEVIPKCRRNPGTGRTMGLEEWVDFRGDWWVGLYPLEEVIMIAQI